MWRGVTGRRRIGRPRWWRRRGLRPGSPVEGLRCGSGRWRPGAGRRGSRRPAGRDLGVLVHTLWSMRRLDRPWARLTTAVSARSCSCPPAVASQSSVRLARLSASGLDQRRRRCPRCPERSRRPDGSRPPRSRPPRPTTTMRWSLPSRVSTVCTRSPAAPPSTDGSSSATTTASWATGSSQRPNSAGRGGPRLVPVVHQVAERAGCRRAEQPVPERAGVRVRIDRHDRIVAVFGRP
jgi:hypothetical protein